MIAKVHINIPIWKYPYIMDCQKYVNDMWLASQLYSYVPLHETSEDWWCICKSLMTKMTFYQFNVATCYSIIILAQQSQFSLFCMLNKLRLILCCFVGLNFKISKVVNLNYVCYVANFLLIVHLAVKSNFHQFKHIYIRSRNCQKQ